MINGLHNESLMKLGSILISQLKDNNYAKSTITAYECHLRRLERFMAGIEAGTYSAKVGTSFLESTYCNETKRRRRNFLAFISRLDDCLQGIPYHVYHCRKPVKSTPAQHAHIEDHYIRHCTEKGNAPSTLQAKRAAFARLMNHAADFGCHVISDLEAAHVTRAVLAESNQNYFGYYREILRFMAANEYIGYDYSTLIPGCHRAFHLPSTYTREERLRLENAPDRNTPLGKRDYAIILLANRLGMRSGDISGLTFDKVSFDEDTISFEQDKTREPHMLYLVQDVRDAIQDYIKNGRPESADGHVFIMHKAPYYPVSAIAIHGIVSKGFRTAHIDTSNKKHGAHSLRSSLATDMVNTGESYDQTRKVLGHRSPDAIKHYARLDVERLRLCALEARKPTGFFERFLNGEEVLL